MKKSKSRSRDGNLCKHAFHFSNKCPLKSIVNSQKECNEKFVRMDISDHFNIYGMQMWKEIFWNTFKGTKFEVKVLFFLYS